MMRGRGLPGRPMAGVRGGGLDQREGRRGAGEGRETADVAAASPRRGCGSRGDDPSVPRSPPDLFF